MPILVTGGAGYIGSVIVDLLVREGNEVVVIDDLRYGHRQTIPPGVKFFEANIVDAAAVKSVFAKHRFDAVVHLAAESTIGKSNVDPGEFYAVNVQGGINLLEAMRQTGVQRMIFSSTAAIFGEPEQIPITESAAKKPVNAYGETKLAFEKAMIWYQKSFDLKHVSFRYFNACGGTERLGEDRAKETHIIPLLFEVAQGKRSSLSLFGSDYPTPDGTCIRDYVHVSDIAQAHLLGLQHIDALGTAAFNLGSGTGNSNRQVIDAALQVTGLPIPIEDAPRREGDPAVLVATSELASKVLGWKPQYTDLTQMVQSAWDWRERNPLGYEGQSK